MFNYRILSETERIIEPYTYFDVEFSDGEKVYIQEYRITNDAKEMELQLLNDVQFPAYIYYLENNII
jgi:hypothetical protein